jgi:uncharacterized protein YcbK (DUF882 family)
VIGVTQHFSIEEFACRSGDPYPVSNLDEFDKRGRTWLETRLLPLCATLEIIRDAAGGERITIDSGYRTLAYDDRLYRLSAKNGDVAPATSSQHPKGRAADIRHASLSPQALHALILRLWDDDKLPFLGGLGEYENFVHLDCRPRPADNPTHLAQWTGGRKSNVA